MNKNKKPGWIKRHADKLFSMLIGAAAAVIGMYHLDFFHMMDDMGSMALLKLYAIVMLLIIAVIYVSYTLHEAGHLITGLLSGYKFSSFRVGSLMWVKQDGKIRLRRFSLSGTGGQCLMEPPEGDRFPTLLYNMGGVIANLALAAICLALYFPLRETVYPGMFLLMTAFTNLIFAIQNGVPRSSGPAHNDGCNALALRRHPEHTRDFAIQLRSNMLLSQGKGYEDMPEEWFALPSDEEMRSHMCAFRAVMAENRMMARRQFSEADQLAARLLESAAIANLHRPLLVCDRIFCELMGENRAEAVEALLTKKQKRVMAAMTRSPAALRAQYALALLHEKNPSRAAAYRKLLDKRLKKYPYPADAEAERMLAAAAEARSAEILQ